MVTKNRFLKNLLSLLFFLFYLNSNAQQYSDKEIGFDRDKLKSEITLNKGFINPKFIETYLDTLRSQALLRFKLGKNEYIQKNKIFNEELPNLEVQRYAGCESFTFSGQNPFINWTLTNNIAPFSNYVFENHNGILGETFLNDIIGGNRFQALQSNNVDPHLGLVPASVMKIGNAGTNYRREMISRSFVINSIEDFLVYDFAIVLQDPAHETGRPFYSIVLRRENGEAINCSRVNYEAIPGNEGFHQSPQSQDVYVRPWATNIIKPVDFGIQIGESVTIEVMVSDCNASGHFGYGYFDVKCLTEDQIIKVTGNQCLDNTVEFTTILDENNNFEWSIKDQNGNSLNLPNSSSPQFTHVFNQAGTYIVDLSVRYYTTDDPCNIFSVFQKVITIAEKCNECIDCTSFNLLKGEKYLLSGWVRESNADDSADIEQYKNYEHAFISVSSYDINGTLISQPYNFFASGDVIEGWQRIVGEFVVPQNIEDIQIDLNNVDKSKIAYFDDIRVLPTKGNMKSFVYDKTTQRLMAELDENNYGTFYEYDIEGGLVRIKKETEKGIFTIKETRSGNAKTD